MYKKMTPQAAYEAYRDAIYRLKQKGELSEKRELPPATWEEVSAEGKARFAQIALKMNSAIAEFTRE